MNIVVSKVSTKAVTNRNGLFSILTEGERLHPTDVQLLLLNACPTRPFDKNLKKKDTWYRMISL